MTIESQQKSFLLTSLALAPTVWMLSFNFGVYKTVFFDHLFVIWAISIAALICGFVVKLDEQLVSFSTWKGRALLILPTIWVLSGYWVTQHQGVAIYWLDILLTVATVFLSLPYLLYYVVLILVPGAESIYSKKLMISLVLITALTGSIGFLVGHYHPRFLFCETFEIAGNHLPENCWSKTDSR